MENDPGGKQPSIRIERSGRLDNRSGRFSGSGRLLAPEDQPDGTGMRWLVGGILLAGFGIGLYFLVFTPTSDPGIAVGGGNAQLALTPPTAPAASVTFSTSAEEGEGGEGVSRESEKNLQAWRKLSAAVQVAPSPSPGAGRAPAVPAVKDADFAAIAARQERADAMFKEQKVFHALPADEQDAVMGKIQSAVHDIEHEPGNSSHFLELAKIQADNSMHQAVFNTLFQAYKKFPRDPAVLEARADYHRRWGYRREAEEMYNELLAVDPSNEKAKKGLVEVGRLLAHPVPPPAGR